MVFSETNLNFQMALWPKQFFILNELKGTLSSQISPLGRREKVPECEPQTPRPAAAGEGRTGWIGGAPGDGACMTGQKSRRLEMKLSP